MRIKFYIVHVLTFFNVIVPVDYQCTRVLYNLLVSSKTSVNPVGIKVSSLFKKRVVSLVIALFIFVISILAKTTTLTSAAGSISGGGTWSGGIPATGDIVIVSTGCTLTIGADFSLAELRINGGGTVTLSPSYTLTVTGNVTVNNNSANGATTINIINATSTLNVTGNVIINPPANTNTNTINVNAGTLNCGNITTTCTNTAQKTDIRITSGSLTASGYSSIGTQSGSNTFRFAGGGTANINGNFAGSAFTGSSGTLNISGSFAPNSFTANTCTINYNGTGSQTIANLAYSNLNCSNSGLKSTSAAIIVSNNITISGGTLALGANLTVTGNLNVSAGILDCQTYNVSGGTFTLAAGASLVSADASGITASGASGSIRTTFRNYSTGANYEFDAGVAQYTGNGLPGTVNNLTINNPNSVSLSQAVAVDGSLALANGSIDLGSNDLTIGASGNITGTFGSTTMVITGGIGSLKKLGNVTTDFTMIYPVGSGGYYTPMEITSLTAIVNPVSSVALHAAPIQKIPSTSALKKYWSVTTTNLSSINANINFTYNSLEAEGTESNYVTRKFDGSVFQTPEGAAINTTTNVLSAVGATSLSGDWTAIDLNGITPVINGLASVFQGRTQVYTITPGYSDYNWVVSGGSITSGQGTNTIVVNWNNTTGTGNVFAGYTQGGLSVALPVLAVTRYAFPLSCFQYKRQIDIKGTMVNGGPHVNFQLLVNVTDATLKSVDNGGHIAHNGGYDIYFASDAAGTMPLEYQLDYYDPATGQLVVWVKMPSLAGSNSSIYLFYGNYSITFDGSSANVWGSDYVGVYHFGQSLNDYSLGCNDGINVGTSTVTGKIGQGRRFNRNEKDFIQLTNESPFNFENQMTVSFWINLNSYPAAGNDWMDYIVKGDNKNWRFVGNKPNASMYYCFGNEYSDDLSSANNSAPVSTWVHIVGTFNGNNTPSPLKNLFVNGVKVSRTANHASIFDYLTDNSPVLVGMNSQAQDTRAFDGIMDELQISNQYKTDGWIITGYRNQSDLTNVSLSALGEQAITIVAAATGGTATATPNSVFAREYSGLILTGYTGTSIQWQSSSDNVTFADLPGKTNASQQTDPLLASTYFRAIVINGGCPSASSSAYVSVTPPYITCSDGKRKKITIDNSKYTGTDDLVNFPFLLQINNDADLRQVPVGKVQSNKGWDIRFTSNDGISMLPQQVESYDPVNGSILVWVQIPRINASQNTEIYMYYGDTNFAISDPSISAVFGSEYLGVYHMGTGTGKSLFELNDASVKGNNATNTGTTNVATGKIGTASGFNGTSQYVTLPNGSQFEIPNNGKLTLSGWVNITTYSASAYAKYMDKGTGSWTLRRDNGSSRVEMRQEYQNPAYISAINTSGIATGAWHYLVATYDHEINNMTLYIDGSAAASSKNVPANQIIQNNANQVRVGADAGATPGNYFRGNMDEVRIQNVARTTDWIKFEYDNMNAPVGFATISAETSCSLGAPTPGTASTNKAYLCTGQSATLTLTGYDGGIYWQQSTDNSNWSYITGENSATLSTGAITQNTYFRASVSNCCEAFSNAVLISYVAVLPPALDFVVTDVKCHGQSNGSVDLTVSQGTGSFSYLWSETSITQDISYLAIGTYAVTVTDIGNNCSTTSQAAVNQPTILAVSIAKTDETCPGVANGSATATPSGGTSPYAYSWSNTSSSFNNTGLTNGLYTLTVTDSRTCTVSESTSIATTNPAPVAPTSVSPDRDNLCADDAGNINLSVTGGSGITLRWFTGSCGDTDIGTTNPLSLPSPVSSTTYYVRWENGCGNSVCTSVVVTVNPLPPTSLIHHDE